MLIPDNNTDKFYLLLFLLLIAAVPIGCVLRNARIEYSLQTCIGQKVFTEQQCQYLHSSFRTE